MQVNQQARAAPARPSAHVGEVGGDVCAGAAGRETIGPRPEYALNRPFSLNILHILRLETTMPDLASAILSLRCGRVGGHMVAGGARHAEDAALR